MLLLFTNLYYSMFQGSWSNDRTMEVFITSCRNELNTLGTFLTSIFGDNQMTNLGEGMFPNYSANNFLSLISLTLALITSIGIVVLAVKGIKRIFAVFFTFGR